MSRRGSPLVGYAGSDDEDVEVEPEGPPKKKRKLPPLSSKLVAITVTDNPALHQGRVRSFPHVDGRWACHVYVPVASEVGEQLGEVLSSAFQAAKAKVPALHPIGLNDGREEYKNAVRRVAASHQGWTLSLTEFIRLENDDRSRAFLAVQVGAGHKQLGGLSDALTPTLRAIKQSEFYPEPKFHVSIGWALLERNGVDKPCEDFPTIAELPQNVIEDLDRDFGSQLRRPSARVKVEDVCVKIGKDAFRWRLGQ